jgi:hypothetical protein
MTSSKQQGSGMDLSGTIGKDRSCPTGSAALALRSSEHPTPPASRFQLIPRHAGLNRISGSIDPPEARFLFPPPAAPPPLTFAEPEAACLSVIPLMLPKLLDSHPIAREVSEVADPIPQSEPHSPSAPVRQSFESEAAHYVQLVESEASSFLEPEAATPYAAQPHASTRPWMRPAAPAGIAIMVLGFLLVGPSSITLQRSVAAKDHSAPEKFSALASSLHQPALAETGVATPVPSPNPAFSEAKSHVFVHASDRSWVVACADNKVLFSRLFTAGNRQTLEFNRRAIVRLGSAGSVQILIDGESAGALGAVGQVRIVEFTPGNSHFLKGGEIEDCTKGR